MSLATNLQKLLTAHSISVMELARKTHIPQPVIHRLVNGNTPNPTVFTLSPIANFFSISINQLIDEVPLPQKIHLKEVVSIEHHKHNLKVDIVDWKYPVSVKARAKKDSNLYALNMKDYKYDVSDPRFSENTIITIDSCLLPINENYILIHKKASVYPYIAQFLKDKDGVFIKLLNQNFLVREISKDEKIIGVVIEAYTNYIQNRSNE